MPFKIKRYLINVFFISLVISCVPRAKYVALEIETVQLSSQLQKTQFNNTKMNLKQVTVPSLDLTKSIPFYEKLGLRLIVNSLPRYARFECPDGNSTFSIHQVEKLPTGEGIHVYFECKNLDEYVAELKSKGIEFDQDPTDQRWLWREARLKDLDGNQLILYYGGENRLNPPWRVKN